MKWAEGEVMPLPLKHKLEILVALFLVVLFGGWALLSYQDRHTGDPTGHAVYLEDLPGIQKDVSALCGGDEVNPLTRNCYNDWLDTYGFQKDVVGDWYIWRDK